jgi:hypothetical protein
MAEESQKRGAAEGALVGAAKAIGSALGKVASLAGVAGEAEKTEAPAENLYQADYIGSGTFVIHKPKRKSAKLRQSRLRGTTRGARK